MELIEIFFDTNFLRRKNIEDYSMFQFGRTVEDFINSLGVSNMSDCFNINISEITIEELKKQIIDSFHCDLGELKCTFNKIKKIGNNSLKIDEGIEYSVKLDLLIKEYLESHNINLVKIKNVSFDKIIQRAINKKKPFSGENSESDKGFKDVVLWESIIEYAKISENKRFVLFTKNEKDFPKELENEFRIITEKEIQIVKEITQVQEKALLEQARINKGLLSLKWLKEHEEYLLEKVNIYFANSKDYRGYKIWTINRLEDLVYKGNDFYSFMIFDNEDNIEYQWYVEAKYNDEKLDIVSIVVCL